VLRLLERFKAFSVQKTIAALVKLVGVVIALAAGAGLWGFFVVWLVTDIVGRLMLLAFGLQTIRRNGLSGFLRERSEGWAPVARFAVWTNLVTTVALPVKHFDMLLVGALVSVESVGVYRIIKRIATLMTMVSDSVYQVIYPRLAALLATEDIQAALVLARRTGAMLLLFTASAAVLVALFGRVFMEFVFGEEFADMLSLNTYMFLRAVSCGFVVVHPLFLALGFVKREVGIIIVSNLLYLAAAFVLGSQLGLIGIVLAYGVQFVSVLIPKILVIRGTLTRSTKIVGEPAG
jgi:O-antigen/teichoic acid export membrane protein